MAQLRRHSSEFEARDTTVVVVGSAPAWAFKLYWAENDLEPLIGLPDPRHAVLRRYGQELKLTKFGRLPAQVIVDRSGMVRYAYYGHHWTDIPQIAEMLQVLDAIDAETAPASEHALAATPGGAG